MKQAIEDHAKRRKEIKAQVKTAGQNNRIRRESRTAKPTR